MSLQRYTVFLYSGVVHGASPKGFEDPDDALKNPHWERREMLRLDLITRTWIRFNDEASQEARNLDLPGIDQEIVGQRIEKFLRAEWDIELTDRERVQIRI